MSDIAITTSASSGALTDIPADQEFVISRVFDAPRDLVWSALTDPKHLSKWWGPKGFTMQVANLDLRPGGLFHYAMRSPDGMEMWGKFVYREIVAPERIVFINSFSDADGGTSRHPWSATWPLEVLNTVTLTEADGKTTLTQRGGPIHSSETERTTFVGGHESMRKGFSGTFDQLDDYLATMAEGGTMSDSIASDPQITITRVFDAPRELVFRAWTEPEHLARWYAPNGCTVEVGSVDLRVGGAFRHCIRNPKVQDCWCAATYQEIVPPERLVYKLAFADMEGNFKDTPEFLKGLDWPAETTVTVTFVDRDGKTEVTLHQTVSEALAKRTGAYPSWLQMLDRLAALVEQE